MADTTSSADVTTLGDPIYQGEGKWFKFTFTVDGEAVDLTGSTFSFNVKSALSDSTYVYQAEASAFDETDIATGIIKVALMASITSGMAVGTYWGELTTVLIADTNVDKKLVKFKIKQGVAS